MDIIESYIFVRYYISLNESKESYGLKLYWAVRTVTAYKPKKFLKFLMTFKYLVIAASRTCNTELQLQR